MISITNKIKHRIKNILSGSQNQDIIYQINGELETINISLPSSHKLPLYQSLYKLYDKKIINIAKCIFNEIGGTCIDIGANIGDTAVAIRASSNMPIICVEGDAEFFSYLDKNTLGLKDITIVKSFIGGEQKDVKGQFIKKDGTGKIIENPSASSSISFITINNLLSNLNLKPADISLVKIDTDGFDFEIIMGNIDFINSHKISLFFEYEINSTESHLKSLEVIDTLSKKGYKFIVYDNFGNFYTSVSVDFVNRFNEINSYIKSGSINGGGIYYVDVFAVANDTLFKNIYKSELSTF